MSQISFYPAAEQEPVFDLRVRTAISVSYQSAKTLRRQGHLLEAFNAFKQTRHAVRANAHCVGYEGWVVKVQKHLADLAWLMHKDDEALFECDVLCAFTGARNYVGYMTNTHFG